MTTSIAIVETGVAATTPHTNPALAYLATLDKEQSRSGGIRSLNAIARLVLGDAASGSRDDFMAVPWHCIRPEQAGLIRSELRNRYKPSSAVTHLSHLRGVIRQVWILAIDPAFDAEMRERVLFALRTRGLKKNEDSDTAPGRDLSAGEISALVDVCRRDKNVPAGTRDAAIIGLMASVAGLRRTEVVTLSMADLNREAKTLLIHGKGNKNRRAYLQNGAGDALADWLHFRGTEPGPLFCPVNKAGAVTVASMSAQAIYNMLKKRAQQAGISDFSPHDLRRTFVGDLLDAGEDVVTVSKLVGHADPATTKKYDRRGPKAKRQAVGKLHFPWARRFKDD